MNATKLHVWAIVEECQMYNGESFRIHGVYSKKEYAEKAVKKRHTQYVAIKTVHILKFTVQGAQHVFSNVFQSGE